MSNDYYIPEDDRCNDSGEESFDEYKMLCDALSECVPVLSCEKLSLVVRSCGANMSDVYGRVEEVQTVEVIEWRTAA